MLLADFGTSYCKILDTASEGGPRIVATRDLDRAFSADLATGHNAARRSRRSINELTALARGGIELVGVIRLADKSAVQVLNIYSVGGQNCHGCFVLE